MTWFLTATGKRFDLDDIERSVARISIEDIAKPLSQINRFGGHTLAPYSVAQHSVLVSRLLDTPELRRYGLLHDAAEAFLPGGDIVRPGKMWICKHTDALRDLEAELERCILLRFGLPPGLPREVKRADRVALLTERRDVMPQQEDDTPWSEDWQGIDPSPRIIRPWSAADAEREFLEEFGELWLSGYYSPLDPGAITYRSPVAEGHAPCDVNSTLGRFGDVAFLRKPSPTEEAAIAHGIQWDSEGRSLNPLHDLALPPIIGITGLAGSGKSTVAQMLAEIAGYRRVRFAQPLKDMLRAMGLSADQVDGDQKGDPCELLCGQTPRHAMQTLGTEWGRERLGTDVWVNAAMRHVKAIAAPRVVFDDCRFENEVEAIKLRGGVVIGVTRPSVESAGSHASEAMASSAGDGDWSLLNDGSLDKLRTWVAHLVGRLAGEREMSAHA